MRVQCVYMNFVYAYKPLFMATKLYLDMGVCIHRNDVIVTGKNRYMCDCL